MLSTADEAEAAIGGAVAHLENVYAVFERVLDRANTDRQRLGLRTSPGRNHWGSTGR